MPTDNEKYTDSLIYSIQDYIEKLQYLGRNKRVELRALNYYKILHWIYSWADWYQVSEEYKLRIEELMNCIILWNSHIVLPEIIPQSFYTNVNSPQNMETWQIITVDPSAIGIPETPSYTLTVNATNGGFGVDMIVDKTDLDGNKNGTTPFTRRYNENTTVQLTAPNSLITGYLFDYWMIGGVIQSDSASTISVTLTSNKTVTVVYRAPQPPIGSITINKTILDGETPVTDDYTSFTVTLSRNDLVLRTGTVSIINPLVFSSLELGEYTITETENFNYSTTLNPKTVTLAVGPTLNQTVTFTNTILVPEVRGSITVTKEMYNDDRNDIFTYYLFGAGIGQSAQGDTTQPATFTNLPLGTYTLIEAQVANFSVVSITPNDGINFKVGEVTLTTEDKDQTMNVVNAVVVDSGAVIITFVVDPPNESQLWEVTLTPTIGDPLGPKSGNSTSPLVFNLVPYGSYVISETVVPGYSSNISTNPVTVSADNKTAYVTITHQNMA